MIADNSTTGVRQYNNDILSHFAVFQARLQEKRDSLAASSSAAVGLATAPPNPTRLDDASAEKAMAFVADQAQSSPESISNVHSGLDPDRVARLLGLLD